MRAIGGFELYNSYPIGLVGTAHGPASAHADGVAGGGLAQHVTRPDGQVVSRSQCAAVDGHRDGCPRPGQAQAVGNHGGRYGHRISTWHLAVVEQDVSTRTGQRISRPVERVRPGGGVAAAIPEKAVGECPLHQARSALGRVLVGRIFLVVDLTRQDTPGVAEGDHPAARLAADVVHRPRTEGHVGRREVGKVLSRQGQVGITRTAGKGALAQVVRSVERAAYEVQSVAPGTRNEVMKRVQRTARLVEHVVAGRAGQYRGRIARYAHQPQSTLVDERIVADAQGGAGVHVEGGGRGYAHAAVAIERNGVAVELESTGLHGQAPIVYKVKFAVELVSARTRIYHHVTERVGGGPERVARAARRAAQKEGTVVVVLIEPIVAKQIATYGYVVYIGHEHPPRDGHFVADRQRIL